MAQRDDINLKHFHSRSKQPRVIGNLPDQTRYQPVNLYINFDTDFSNPSDKLDIIKFRYTGISPVITPASISRSKKNIKSCMRSTFQA